MVLIAGEAENRLCVGISPVISLDLFNQLPIPGHSGISLAVLSIGHDSMSYRK